MWVTENNKGKRGERKSTRKGNNRKEMKCFLPLLELPHLYLSYHKWQQTFLLPADGVQAE